MARINKVLSIILDGCGIGGAPDAKQYGDEGANTLLHVVKEMEPEIPNLMELGLGKLLRLKNAEEPIACFGRMNEASAGKDTISGHWELAGLTLKKPFPIYPKGFPKAVVAKLEQETGMQFIGNRCVTGTDIIQELGDQHYVTGKLILFTTEDSTLQIAAHEDVVPVQALYGMCRIARRVMTGEHAVGRVIARPFTGEHNAYTYIENARRDFSVEPFGDTMLDVLHKNHVDVYTVGKPDDIFSHRGITVANHAGDGNNDVIVGILKALKSMKAGVCLANLADTDACGHARSSKDFAESLEIFDSYLPDILKALGDDGVLIITADHGCDPSFNGSGHTRENVPLLVWGLCIDEGVDLGTRTGFADVAKTTLDMLGIENTLDGTSFYPEIRLD